MPASATTRHYPYIQPLLRRYVVSGRASQGRWPGVAAPVAAAAPVLAGRGAEVPGKGSMPGAVTAARGEPAGLRSEPVPLAGPRQGGIRTRPPRHLRLPRLARGAADRCASGGAARRGLAAGPWWEQSWAGARPGVRCGRSRPRLNGGVPAGQAWPAARFYIRGLRDRLAKAIAAGAVSRRHGGVLCPGQRRSRWRRAR